ncbi:MAG TPA: hypothetical protein VJT32_11175 [bacterium]|nr:hypothetical protein [bacterium]
MSKRTHLSRRAAVAIAVVTLAALLSGPVPAGPAPAPAPAFTLKGLNGHLLSLAEFKGSPVILLFWAPW